MVLNFCLGAGYSVSIDYDAECRSQNPIFGVQANVELNFDLRDRYSVFTEYGALFRSQTSKFGMY